MNIFGTYDIRGVYPEELNEEIAYTLGKAFVVYLKCKRVVVGRDARLSSYKLFDALVTGLRDQGADVVDIGLCTTPMNYFANSYYKFDASIMITASHLGKESNGFKLCGRNSDFLSYHHGGKEIERLVLENKFSTVKNKGKFFQQNIFEDYKMFILKKTKKTKLKVVVDAANMMGALDGKILSEVCNVKPLYFEIDGSFPNHAVNPLFPENTLALRRAMVKSKADLGIAFDGDSDRVVFIDEKGKTVAPDILFAFLAFNTLEKKESVICDMRSSRIVEEKIKEKKGIPLFSLAGHTFIKESMKKYNAVLGGEKSGHYYFKKFYYSESPLLTSLIIIHILSKTKKPFSELLQPYLKYASSKEINFSVINKKRTLKLVESYFKKQAEKIIHKDGISVYCKDFWFNLRESQTEPLLRLNAEARTGSQLKELIKIIKTIIKV